MKRTLLNFTLLIQTETKKAKIPNPAGHLSIAVIAIPTQERERRIPNSTNNKSEPRKDVMGTHKFSFKSTDNQTETKFNTNTETKSTSKIRIKINQTHKER